MKTIALDPAVQVASVAMVKSGLRSPTIARLLKRGQSEIEIHLGWWVHERMRSVEGRTYSAYRATAAADLKVGHQAAMRWHQTFLRSSQLSPDVDSKALVAEEFHRQTPNVRQDLAQWAKWDGVAPKGSTPSSMRP